MDYKQPSFYHFSQDSIELANYVAMKMHGHPIENFLDLGSGCGVIGLEIAQKLENIQKMTLLEPQLEFHEFINNNIKHFLASSTKVELVHSKISNFQPNEYFDLIVSNPPYFDPKAGKQSLDFNKQVCRSFIYDSPRLWIEKMYQWLKPGGHAFLVFPPLESQWQVLVNDINLNLTKEIDLNRVSIFSIYKK